MTEQTSTIYALSTPAGRGAIAIIRLSGPRVASALMALTNKPLPAPRESVVRYLYHPQSKAALDEALVLYFKAPHSFTGEDMVEFHLHGGPMVVGSVLEALAEIDGLSPAEAGAFSKRAVLNGRMDLTRAEAIADLIDAETQAQQSQALRQMQGALGVLYRDWRQQLAAALAHWEADIEFADEDLEEDLQEDSAGGIERAVLANLRQLADDMAKHLAEPRGQSLRAGIELALIGAPNVGKSSLLNRLAGREAAIVSARAGTTRDIVEIRLALGGVPVTIADTAGIQEAGDDIEREGVRRARKKADEADIRLFVYAPDVVAEMLPITAQEGDFHIANKCDLQTVEPSQFDKQKIWPLSAKTGEGLTAFLPVLEEVVKNRFGLTEHPALTRTRHREAVQKAYNALMRALQGAENGDTENEGIKSKEVGKSANKNRTDIKLAPELIAEDIRLAMREIGRITGEVDIESLLDIVFRDFCIGK
ncbi:MAG: tRNA uridine-5-carboxymethylaminomethyl(34) synthesis GTPase MnmE [Alphaproteobacteria bacterium]|nr:tRNA uridine-5-carboxymethylaminomethyl(34) synthesis GTPase MnmE [Alphaproteobacteria bacterium]